jgi:hypothetical protein
MRRASAISLRTSAKASPSSASLRSSGMDHAQGHIKSLI